MNWNEKDRLHVKSVLDEETGHIKHTLKSYVGGFVDNIIIISLPPYYFIPPFTVVQENFKFGDILSCFDRRVGSPVCLYMIRSKLETDVEVRWAINSIRALKHFKNDFILGLREIIVQKIVQSDIKLVLVLDHFVKDLSREMRNIERERKVLDEKIIKKYIYQLLTALECIHLSGHPYRELKYENVFIKNDGSLLLNYLKPTNDNRFPDVESEYVETRYFKSPEYLLMFRDQKCRTSQDMWSLGCMMAGMLALDTTTTTPSSTTTKKTNKRIFFRGKDWIDQIKKIIDVLGSPTQDDLSPKNFKGSPSSRRFIMSLEKRKKKSFRNIFPNASDEVIDLLTKMLTFNPLKRITVEEALKHPFLEDEVLINEKMKKNSYNYNINGDVEEHKNYIQFLEKENWFSNNEEKLEEALFKEINDEGWVGKNNNYEDLNLRYREKEDCQERILFIREKMTLFNPEVTFVVKIKGSGSVLMICNRVIMLL